MAKGKGKNYKSTASSESSESNTQLMNELMFHYKAWTDDNERRMTRKNGWNDITDAYYGKLPDDWPWQSKVTDPRIRTSLIEKNARLINGKLKGTLAPREQGDIVGAKIQNAIIDYQWDNANDGGSMLAKIAICDIDTRLYQSKFVLVPWKYEVDADGEVVFDGNEFIPLDIRDCGMDFAASHIRDAKWFQHRSWEFLEDMVNELDSEGKPKYKNLGYIQSEIQKKITNGKYTNKKRKDNNYVSRVKTLRGLEERQGTDPSFPMLEVVREYRRDKVIHFCPEYKQIIKEEKNFYEHKKIPVVQLRYYSLQDDPLGESEVEPVLPIWKAIQSTVCAYLDEVMLKIRPPLKIVENAVQIETIVQEPDAQWLVSNMDAVAEMKTNGDSIGFFQSTYSALVSAFNTAMGDLSQGVSGVDPFDPEKTATEVRATMRQQNVRDQKNQSDLAEFIKDVMKMWVSNNKQFLFSDPSKKEMIIRIVGPDKFAYLKRAGLHEMETPSETYQLVSDHIMLRNGDITDLEIMNLLEAGQLPKYAISDNPEESDPMNINVRPKMRINEMGDVAELSIVPEDLDGIYDYIPDVKSMSSTKSEELMQARQRAIAMFTTNPTVLQLLQNEGYKPKIKEIITANLEDFGLYDPERFFEKDTINQGVPPTGGPTPPLANGGVPQVPQAPSGFSPEQQMARPVPVQNAGGVPQGV